METTLFNKAASLFWRGHSALFVAQQLGESHLETIDDAEKFVAERKQNAADIAQTMFRAGARHREVLDALRDLELPDHDANEVSLHAMATVRQEKAAEEHKV